MYSDLVVEADYVREGRKVARVRFKLKDRAKKLRLGYEGKKLELGAINQIGSLQAILIAQFNLTKGQSEQVLGEFELTFIQEKIALIDASKAYKEGKIQNLAAYLMSALKNNYQTVKAKQTEIINIHDVKMEIEFADNKRQVEDLRQRYQQYREDEIYQVLAALPAKQKQQLIDDFKTFVEPAVNTIMKLQASKYNRENVYDSPQIKALLRRFAQRELDEIVLVSFDEFAAEQGDAEREALQKLKSFDPEHPLLRFND